MEFQYINTTESSNKTIVLSSYIKPNDLFNLNNNSFPKLYSENSKFYLGWVKYLTLIKNIQNNSYNKNYIYILIVENINQTNFESSVIESICLLFKFEKVLPIEEECLKTDDFYSEIFLNLTDLKMDLRASLYEDYMEKVDTNECVALFNRTDNCSMFNKDIYSKNLKNNIIDNYNTGIFSYLKSYIFTFGLFINTISFFVFLSGLLRSPKMIFSKYFVLFCLLNIFSLITQKFTKPTKLAVQLFLQNKQVYEILYCKLLIILNISARYFSEFIIVQVSILQFLHIYLPIRIISLKTDYPCVFHLFNIFVFMLVSVEYVIAIIEYRAVYMNSLEYYSESLCDYNLGEMSHFSLFYLLSLDILIIFLLTFSSLAIIFKLCIVSCTQKKIINYKYTKARFWRLSNNEAESSRIETVTLSNQVATSSKSNKNLINKTIITLSISTILFNFFHDIFAFLLSTIYFNDFYFDFNALFSVYRLIKLVYLMKFSIINLLFFVFSKNFRIHFFLVLKDVCSILTCKKNQF